MNNNGMQRDLAEIMRDEMVVRDRILSLIRERAMTIPEIGQALAVPEREVTLWIMSLWRYGRVVEKGDPDENGFCLYHASE
jgi:predicted transcriptional regulator